jgi:hypothetical protein
MKLTPAGIGSFFLGAAAHSVSGLFTAPLSAEIGPRTVALNQRPFYLDPLLLPDAGTVIELAVRDMIDPDLANGLLRNHGISMWAVTGGLEGKEYYRSAAEAWRKVADLARSVPGPDIYLDLARRGRLAPGVATRAIIRAGGNPGAWLGLGKLLREVPSADAVIDAVAHDRIDPDTAAAWMLDAGANVEKFQQMERWFHVPPPVGHLIELRRRGLIATDTELGEWLKLHALKMPRTLEFYGELTKGIPSTTDLITMGIREGFRPELARVYDYYSEFPELTRPWWGKLGLDYPIGIRENVRGQEKDLTLADIFWASHWHVMPLGSAFAAYQRFRPDRMAKYQEENPNIRPFLLSDLQLHMRLADLPPGVRDWMVALSHPPPTRRDIHWAVQYAGKDRAWVQNAWMDLGASVENAVLQADIEEGRTVERETRWMVAVKNRARQQTIRMIEGLYEDGTIERPFAMRQLSDAGLPAELSTQLLDITDFRVERSLVRASIAATGRDFLSGELSIADAETQLRRIGVQDSRIRNYLAAWSVRRDRRRKQAETAKITGWVSAGLLDVPTARRRLETLGWTDPDETLLLAEAQGKLAKRQAAEAKSFERDARTRARELERLARDADSQGRKLRADANRVAPRSVLLKWLRDAIISEDDFRQMMRERGYEDSLIEDYIRDSRVEKPVRVERTAKGAAFPRPPGSAHPAVGTVGKWFKADIISEDDFRHALGDLGYAGEDIEHYVREYAPATNGQSVP